jgi:signal transduction histidine kinase
LRTRAEEQFNLLNALTLSSRQIANGAGIAIQVETDGETQPLSEIIEENLLRIGQEAVTNAVKHSGASAVKIALHYQSQKVVLHVHDNGKGFVTETCAGPKDGHFGLLGIRERTERLAGFVTITSSPGNGTSVHVEIPISPLAKTLAQNHIPPAEISEHEERV